MYGIFTYIWVIFGVNVGKYSIHGVSGIIAHQIALIITHSPHHSISFTLPHDGSMYALYGNIYHQYTPVLLASFPIHGSVMGKFYTTQMFQFLIENHRKTRHSKDRSPRADELGFETPTVRALCGEAPKKGWFFPHA